MKILIIIPAYNESKSIVRVVNDLSVHCPSFDILIINDGSHDRTADLCRAHGYPLLDLPVNLGISGAFSAGMKYAFRHGYDGAIQFDADGQHRCEFIQPMVNKLAEGYDIVCGSRYLTGRRPFTLRMLGSRMISLAIRLTTGKKLTDPTSGLRLYTRSIIQQFATQINYTPEPDTVSYLIRAGARVTEVPVIIDDRVTGESYFSAVVALRYMLRICVSILLVQWLRCRCYIENGDI